MLPPQSNSNNNNNAINLANNVNINNNTEKFDFLNVFVKLFNAEEDSSTGNLTKLSILRVSIFILFFYKFKILFLFF